MSFRFAGKLPKGFVISKPIAHENYDATLLRELDAAGQLIKTRKRDGWKLLTTIDTKGLVRIYTDGMNEVDSRLDHIKDEVRSLRFPHRSLLVGECISDIDNQDDIGRVGGLLHANTLRANKIQHHSGKLKLMIFGAIFLNGEYVTTPYIEVLPYLQDMVSQDTTSSVLTVPVLNQSLSEAQKTVIQNQWEGLVLYEKNFCYTFRLDGKNPQRPKGCFKWKPIFEDDFIVREKIMRPNGNTVKEVVLLQIDPATRKEFECGKLGSFTREMREQLAGDDQYPFVVQAAFEMRYPKSGKIRNARFVRIRGDKKIKDCVAPKSYNSGV